MIFGKKRSAPRGAARTRCEQVEADDSKWRGEPAGGLGAPSPAQASTRQTNNDFIAPGTRAIGACSPRLAKPMCS